MLTALAELARGGQRNTVIFDSDVTTMDQVRDARDSLITRVFLAGGKDAGGKDIQAAVTIDPGIADKFKEIRLTQ